MRSWHVVGLALVGVLALTYGIGHSMGSASSDPGRSAAKVPNSVARAPKKFVPSRMAAVGDSVTAGFLTCFNRTCPANSWSTGTSIDSHYKRILAVNPKIAGHAKNFGELNATSADLKAEAAKAVRYRAEYVTILIGANDACTRRVEDMTPVTTFGDNIYAGLRELKKGLPNARVLIVSIPDVYRLWQLGHASILATLSWTVFPGCGSLLAKSWSKAPADNRRRLRVAARIDAFDKQLAAACRAYGGHCRWVDLKAHQVAFTMDLVDPVDHFHPNLKGQAELARVTYPGNFDW